jgi:arginyl-tRNA synthetase
MTSFEGETGPYLQYAHARLCSIIRKAEIRHGMLGYANLSLLTESHARDLVRLLSQWPDAFQQTFKTQEPVTTHTYLFRLTHVLSTSIDHLNGYRERIRTEAGSSGVVRLHKRGIAQWHETSWSYSC